MSKKHFIALADAIRQFEGTEHEFSREQLYAMQSFCAACNPRFNAERWLGYIRGECGPSGGKVKAKAA